MEKILLGGVRAPKTPIEQKDKDYNIPWNSDSKETLRLWFYGWFPRIFRVSRKLYKFYFLKVD